MIFKCWFSPERARRCGWPFKRSHERHAAQAEVALYPRSSEQRIDENISERSKARLTVETVSQDAFFCFGTMLGKPIRRPVVWQRFQAPRLISGRWIGSYDPCTGRGAIKDLLRHGPHSCGRFSRRIFQSRQDLTSRRATPSRVCPMSCSSTMIASCRRISCAGRQDPQSGLGNWSFGRGSRSKDAMTEGSMLIGARSVRREARCPWSRSATLPIVSSPEEGVRPL